MKVLTFENIDSLKMRGYFIDSLKNRKNCNINLDSLKKLNMYNIKSTPYLYLLRDINNQTMRNLEKFICLKWKTISESLDDTDTIDFKENNIEDICNFFLNIDETKNHRIYFFIQIIHQYFFP